MGRVDFSSSRRELGVEVGRGSSRRMREGGGGGGGPGGRGEVEERSQGTHLSQRKSRWNERGKVLIQHPVR